MNTNIEYNTIIKVERLGSIKGYVVKAKLNEDSHKFLLRGIENNKFVTVMDTNQNLITIPANDILKIETKIEVTADTSMDEENKED